MSEFKALTGTLDAIREQTSGTKIDVAELIEALNSRGYGPFLAGPALITILPSGAIPGMPSVCALIIIFISMQILFAKRHPWVPLRLRKISVNRDKVLQALEKAKPYTAKVDNFFYPRWTFLIRDAFKPMIAAVAIMLSVGIMILGFIPFMAILPATGILFLGLGLTARDGLLFALAFILCIGSMAAIPYGISVMLG